MTDKQNTEEQVPAANQALAFSEQQKLMEDILKKRMKMTAMATALRQYKVPE